MSEVQKHHEIPASKFNKRTLAKLAKKGLFIVWSYWMPGNDGSFANGETGYQLSNGQVRTHLQVLELAK